MAGQKIVRRLTTLEDRYKGPGGTIVIGLPLTEIIENGNVEDGDEWALFRLTDDGLSCYQIGCEFAANIMDCLIKNKPAVEEVCRYKTEAEARQALDQLPQAEQERTLLRSVEPKQG